MFWTPVAKKNDSYVKHWPNNQMSRTYWHQLESTWFIRVAWVCTKPHFGSCVICLHPSAKQSQKHREREREEERKKDIPESPINCKSNANHSSIQQYNNSKNMFKRYVLLAHEARTLKKRKILRFCAESHPNLPKKIIGLTRLKMFLLWQPLQRHWCKPSSCYPLDRKMSCSLNSNHGSEVLGIESTPRIIKV